MKSRKVCDFEIQTDNLIPTRRRNLVIIYKKKKTRRTVDFAAAANHKVKIKKKNEKGNKNQDLLREQKS